MFSRNDFAFGDWVPTTDEVLVGNPPYRNPGRNSPFTLIRSRLNGTLNGITRTGVRSLPSCGDTCCRGDLKPFAVSMPAQYHCDKNSVAGITCHYRARFTASRLPIEPQNVSQQGLPICCSYHRNRFTFPPASRRGTGGRRRGRIPHPQPLSQQLGEGSKRVGSPSPSTVRDLG